MVKQVKAYIHSVSPWVLSVLIIYFFAFIYLFAENFIFSSNVDMLTFRSVDDQLFQNTIRDIHKNLKFYGLNDYAYGWIFWFPMALLMYPCYLSSVYFSMDIPLLVLPRQISLFFVMGTAFVLYKIVCRYTKNKFLTAMIMLLYLSFPATGFIALRFGTVAQNMFFSALAFYFAISCSKNNIKSIILVAFVFAIAVATKLSAMLIGPLIFLVLADRFAWKLNVYSLKAALTFLGVFLLSFIYLAQLNYPILVQHIKITQFPIEFKSVGASLTDGIFTVTVLPTIGLLLILCLLARPLLEFKATKILNKDFIYIFITLLFSVFYISYTVKQGNFYVCYYFAVLSFLLPLGLLAFDFTNKNIKYFSVILILMLNFSFNYHNIFSGTEDWRKVSWNIYYRKIKDQKILNRISAQKTMQKVLNPVACNTNHFSVIRNLESFAIYSQLRTDIHINDHMILTNWYYDVTRLDIYKNWDIIGFDKITKSFLDQATFEELMNQYQPEVVKTFTNDRDFVQGFLKNPKLYNRNYKVLLDNQDFIYFIEEGLLSSCSS